MGRLFGTDGIRGVANVDLRPTMAFALGRATARRLAEPGTAIVVGQDTRRSGDMFVAAIVAGATSLGIDVDVVGVVPTPALAFLARTGPYRAGIMVSASHNPAEDNGLKVLDADGLKLDDDIEDELEDLIWREAELGGVGNADLGRRIDASDALERYLDHRRGLAGSIDASGLHIVLDGANGSGGAAGRRILEATGARVDAIYVEPDGVNINVGCGATAPAALAREVVARGADVGFALDGDADRLIAVDGDGEIVDGDQVLGILALERLERGALPGGLVVSVLSNGGLQRAVEAGRRRGRAHARRRQVHPRGHAGVGRDARRREIRPRDRARAHHVRRRHRHRTRSPARDDQTHRVLGDTRRGDPAPPAATAGGEGSSQGSVGGRPDPASRDRGCGRTTRAMGDASSSGRPARNPRCG